MAFIGFYLALGTPSFAGALEDYVRKPDDQFAWHPLEQRQVDGLTITHLELVSQQWREHTWRHDMQVVRPEKVRHADIAFLLLTGDGDGTKSLGLLRTLAERAGALAAVVTRIPNQPLYEGRKEDALIAYTFDQYLKSRDETWPLLLPMTKSAVRAMDAVQAFVAQTAQEKIARFVVAGASKRGWTTWLTAAVDSRVRGMAPMVIDMLNMSAQVKWADKVYGRQSKEIREYTNLNLIARIDEPPLVQLRQWVDPYSYRDRYTMPKLLLLGSNDPYWTVDSLRHYWNDLPEPKLVYQTPNAGHDLGGGKEATQTLAAFFQMVADGEPLPHIDWTMKDTSGHKADAQVNVNRPAKTIRLWTADSADRDFRDERWASRELDVQSGSVKALAEVDTPSQGYRAYMFEVVLISSNGQEYKLSTEARVTPDHIR